MCVLKFICVAKHICVARHICVGRYMCVARHMCVAKQICVARHICVGRHMCVARHLRVETTCVSRDAIPVIILPGMGLNQFTVTRNLEEQNIGNRIQQRITKKDPGIIQNNRGSAGTIYEVFCDEVSFQNTPKSQKINF